MAGIQPRLEPHRQFMEDFTGPDYIRLCGIYPYALECHVQSHVSEGCDRGVGTRGRRQPCGLDAATHSGRDPG